MADHDPKLVEDLADVIGNDHWWECDHFNEYEDGCKVGTARAALDFLAERGRLLPPGGEVSTQWMIRNADGVEGEHTDDERAIRQSWAQGITWWDPDGSYELCRCTFTVWPDGTEYIGPWEVVERHPVVPDDSEKGAGDD